VERPVATQLDHSGLLEPDCTGWSLLTWVNEVRIAEFYVQEASQWTQTSLSQTNSNSGPSLEKEMLK